jgi:hypothetical protein
MKKYYPDYEKCRMTEAEYGGYVKDEEIAPLIAKLLDVQTMRKETKSADAMRVAHNRAVRELRALISPAGQSRRQNQPENST